MSKDYRFISEMIKVKFDVRDRFPLYFHSYKDIVKFMSKQALPYCMSSNDILYNDYKRYMKEVSNRCVIMYGQPISCKSCKKFILSLVRLGELSIELSPTNTDNIVSILPTK